MIHGVHLHIVIHISQMRLLGFLLEIMTVSVQRNVNVNAVSVDSTAVNITNVSAILTSNSYMISYMEDYILSMICHCTLEISYLIMGLHH